MLASGTIEFTKIGRPSHLYGNVKKHFEIEIKRMTVTACIG